MTWYADADRYFENTVDMLNYEIETGTGEREVDLVLIFHGLRAYAAARDGRNLHAVPIVHDSLDELTHSEVLWVKDAAYAVRALLNSVDHA